jgi:hypothetical protein
LYICSIIVELEESFVSNLNHLKANYGIIIRKGKNEDAIFTAGLIQELAD